MKYVVRFTVNGDKFYKAAFERLEDAEYFAEKRMSVGSYEVAGAVIFENARVLGVYVNFHGDISWHAN